MLRQNRLFAHCLMILSEDSGYFRMYGLTAGILQRAHKGLYPTAPTISLMSLTP